MFPTACITSIGARHGPACLILGHGDVDSTQVRQTWRRSSQHCIAASGTPATPGLHEITASGEVFISIFGQPFSIGEQSFSATLEVMANPNPIPGCTYPLASNYLSYATLDDGGCEYWGCTDIDAADFNPFANIDDGSCGDGCDPLTGSNCASDSNGDGQVNVTDLLILLGEFGGICE